MIGKTLAHYEINSQLGKGGMGEVYQATDKKLGREVAIKVLPEEFAKDADRVARFQREAKLLASLNHPNIAAIYGLEESDGTNFLVMELVEGNTLDDRIKSGAIPVEEALKLALQIAEALEAAHEKGVIHRDLKPANIKVTPDGKVKVLDFGLAKAFAGEQADLNLSNSPTLSQAATMQGVILGTAAYMSPEQARGKEVDKKADIWAFGAVLFEMLTGKPAFPGEDISEILASVIKGDSNLALLPKNIHSRIRELLTRCLQKDLRKRYADIADARYEIEQVLADPGGVLIQPTTEAETKTSLRQSLPWIAVAVVLTAIISGVAAWILMPAPTSEPKQVYRCLSYELPDRLQFNRDTGGSVQYEFAISPDGSQLVYSTTEGLYLHSMDTQDARHIDGTDEDSVRPFFSPDGRWIGYLYRTQMKLMKVAVSGGAHEELCDASGLSLAPSWDSEDTILYSNAATGIVRVSADIGTTEVLVKGSAANTKEGFPSSPQMLPDGKTLLFTNYVGGDFDNYQIVAQSLESGKRKILLEGGRRARYIPTGHLLYEVANSLYAVPFDLGKLEVIRHEQKIVAEDIGNYAVSNSGTMIYIRQSAIDAVTFSHNIPVWVDREGNEETIPTESNFYMFCKISPDGAQAAFNSGPFVNNMNVWTYDLKREKLTQLTFDEGFCAAPLWSADSEKIIYFSFAAGSISMMRADGIGEIDRLGSKLEWPNVLYPFSKSKEGNALVLAEVTLQPFQADIGIMSMEGDHAIQPLLHEKYNENYPQISPDGRWMAYQSDRTDRYEVYVRPFPDVYSGGPWPISTDGGDSPLWDPDGRELFYRSGDNYMAVEVETEPTFSSGKPEVLFTGTYFDNSNPYNHTFWDISPKDKRFLMIKQPETTDEESLRKINIVINWSEELKEKVPAP
ncbi:MAG: serine/threonine-protein kinase [Acidobacteria bacterium]|nr:serine/threonine-protein kinase [Acidobacteriota bacterium]